MPVFELRSSGRELTIKFICYRCKKFVYMPYDKAMTVEHYGYLRNSELPEDWDTVGYGAILCPECAKAYKLFMGG